MLARFCLSPGCPAKVPSGYCRQHVPRERARPNARIRKLYQSTRWQARRRQVLAAQPLCADCTRAGRLRSAVDVHHVGGHGGDVQRFWTADLLGLCKRCHATRTRNGE